MNAKWMVVMVVAALVGMFDQPAKADDWFLSITIGDELVLQLGPATYGPPIGAYSRPAYQPYGRYYRSPRPTYYTPRWERPQPYPQHYQQHYQQPYQRPPQFYQRPPHFYQRPPRPRPVYNGRPCPPPRPMIIFRPLPPRQVCPPPPRPRCRRYRR